MEQNLRSPEVYDFRQYDHIWQRVAPGLEPYPAAGTEPVASAMADRRLSGQANGGGDEGTADRQALTLRQESQLPGAEQNPCCMGSAAAEMLAVLVGFTEEELEDQRATLALSRQAPSWARQWLRELAAEEGCHARRLMAVYYLINGDCYHPMISGGPIRVGRWCAALRERYHAAACNGLNYARAADETTDPCLARLLKELSGEEYRHADRLLGMLERSLKG